MELAWTRNRVVVAGDLYNVLYDLTRAQWNYNGIGSELSDNIVGHDFSIFGQLHIFIYFSRFLQHVDHVIDNGLLRMGHHLSIQWHLDAIVGGSVMRSLGSVNFIADRNF